MKKQFYFLAAILLCLPMVLKAQSDSKYLAGAVPEEDGKVVFKQTFALPGVSQDVIYDRIHSWMADRLKKNENNSRIVFEDKPKGVIAGSGEEYMVFKSSALSLDRAVVQYQLNATCTNEGCLLEVERIRYTYDEEKITAEDYISDKNALNKTKTKLVRGFSKFRTKTVDFVDELFAGAQAALATSQPVIATKQPAVATQPVVQNQPIVINTTPVETAQPINTQPVAVQPVVQPVTVQAPIAATNTAVSTDELAGYRQLSPDKIPGNIIKMLNEDWMLITAGDKDKFNMMTASWGGFGMLYGKPITFCFINPTRYTYQLMEKGDTYTLTFYTEAYREALQYCGSNSGKNTDKVKGSGLTPITTLEGSQAFAEAWLIIECRKLVSQSLTPEAISNDKVKEEWAGKQLHKMYIGEIINVWVK